MPQMDDLASFERSITDALAQCGCERFTVSDLHRYTRETRQHIYADNVAHGEDIAAPWVTLIIADGVAIFTVFDDPFLVYIVPCVEREMISDTDAFAMCEVAEHINLLRTKYNKTDPDASISRAVAESWLG